MASSSATSFVWSTTLPGSAVPLFDITSRMKPSGAPAYPPSPMRMMRVVAGFIAASCAVAGAVKTMSPSGVMVSSALMVAESATIVASEMSVWAAVPMAVRTSVPMAAVPPT